jgi:hypothetical protein
LLQQFSIAAQTAKEFDILRKNPETGELNFKASGTDATGDRAIARATYAMQNPAAFLGMLTGLNYRRNIRKVCKNDRTKRRSVLHGQQCPCFEPAGSKRIH